MMSGRFLLHTVADLVQSSRRLLHAPKLRAWHEDKMTTDMKELNISEKEEKEATVYGHAS
jgi:hypothetical protein